MSLRNARSKQARFQGENREPGITAPLVKRLDDPDPEVVQAAARALGRIGTLDAVPPWRKPSRARPRPIGSP